MVIEGVEAAAYLRYLVERGGQVERGAQFPRCNDTTLVVSARVRLDVAGRRLFLDGNERALSPLRFQILRYLLERPGQVICAHDLVRARILGAGSEPRFRALVKEIRDRLGPAHGAICTVRGAGYRFDPPRQRP